MVSVLEQMRVFKVLKMNFRHAKPMSEMGSKSTSRRLSISLPVNPRERTWKRDIVIWRDGPEAAVSRCSKQRSYSITSSARASSVGGTSRPRALAVERLMANSNLVGSSTGMSDGFAPWRILST
jgi:hypothetical protein